MLGPSGSGKTTCLRLICWIRTAFPAGLSLFLVRPASNLPPWEPGREYCLQDYALFPHMSILDSVAYGLMVKGVNKSNGCNGARALEKWRWGFVRQRNRTLHGGQRQRVAHRQYW